MESFIKNLQRKPEHLRRRLLYIAAPALTALIALLWFFSQGIIKETGETTAPRLQLEPSAIVKEDTALIWSRLKKEGQRIFETLNSQIPF